jgi:soluble lytic murein transglycosylase-like protein
MSAHKILIPSIVIIVTALTGISQDAAARSSLFGSISFNGKSLAVPYLTEKKTPQDDNKASLKDSLGSDLLVLPRTKGVAAKLKHRPYAAIIKEKSKKYGVRVELVHAVIQAESAYNPRAVSHAGAVGLMQLMPATAKRFGVSDSKNPRQNIDGGVRYLRFLLDYFNNNLKLAVAGYNAGENAVIKHGRKIPPYKETRQYVMNVMKYLRRNQNSNQS